MKASILSVEKQDFPLKDIYDNENENLSNFEALEQVKNNKMPAQCLDLSALQWIPASWLVNLCALCCKLNGWTWDTLQALTSSSSL